MPDTRPAITSGVELSDHLVNAHTLDERWVDAADSDELRAHHAKLHDTGYSDHDHEHT